MRFLVDENLPSAIADGLSNDGHDVLDVAASQHRGQSDSVLWQLAIDQERIFVTRDRDFPLPGARERPPGLVLLRPTIAMRTHEITALFQSAISHIGLPSLRDQITVIEPGRARQRPYSRL